METGGAPNAGRTEAQAMKGGAGPSSAPGQSGSGASRRGGMMSMRFDGKDSAGNEGEKQEEAVSILDGKSDSFNSSITDSLLSSSSILNLKACL